MKIEKATQQCKQLNHLHVFERISVVTPFMVQANRIGLVRERTSIMGYDAMMNQEELIVCKLR